MEVDRMVAEFRHRRDVVTKGLNAIPGITCRVPRGAFYVFPNVRAFGISTSAEVADRLLNEAGVAVLAGTCFGPAGEGYLRLSYANSLSNLQKSLSRIAEWASRVAPLPA
jgi:aspartate/methionine/tyrosine aminotransferase